MLNSIAAGIIAGIALPVVIYFILYFSKIQDISSTLFTNHLVVSNLLPVLLSHCILPDLVLFFIFNSFNWLKAARGVLIASIVLTLTIFIIKVIFRIL